MSNYLKMDEKQTLEALLKLGWAYRRIERETGIRRETISKYHRQLLDSKPARVATGNSVDLVQNRPQWPPAPGSLCDPYRELIEEKLGQGLTAQRIYQDLVFEKAFPGAYNSVKRFCRHLKRSEPEVFARVEVPPGHQMQVDFGKGAPTRYPGSTRYRKPHLFRAVLSFSRHSYEEVVWRQDVGTWIGCFERAFTAFQGVVEVAQIDNLKAGITQACFYDPDINRVFAALARHYGFAVLPIRPRTPRHSGKVERGHGYVESNALRGRRFESLEEQNQHLAWWNQNVARLRIHGTTKQQVWTRFDQYERAALRPLPATPFRLFRSGTRTVGPDGHVEVDGAFYSVPPCYLGFELRVDWDEQLVRIYHGEESLVVHVRTAPGRFQTKDEHLPEHKRYSQLQLENYLLSKAQGIGRDARLWAEKALEVRGLLAYRLLQGMISLTRRFPVGAVNHACAVALRHHAFRYRSFAFVRLPKPSRRSGVPSLEW